MPREEARLEKDEKRMDKGGAEGMNRGELAGDLSGARNPGHVHGYLCIVASVV